ncbi:MAG: ABC transporter substrate-binding protein [Pelagibacteraceae bacterium]|nr:ABC transporter substrate-binding protein [Pelagibacteraceae bacterium]MBT4646548.1 ABC transporter substrate-binding protein [Pelagibacteraceae bacterium]
MLFVKYFFSLIIIFTPLNLKADEVNDWLNKEINTIISAYQNNNLTNENKFLLIEKTINNNFAGSGIAKFVAGKSWNGATKDTKLEYINLFKRHLALNIASMMRGYSDQNYELVNSRYDKKNKVTLIDMEIFSETGSIQVTWRVKKSKERYFVIDLIVADISLVVTKRSEFNSMLKNTNYNLQDFNIKLLEQNNSSYQKLIN